ncbi:MAG: hydroxyacylglutathione hydrolase [Acidobacteriota bacterium]
MALEVERIPAFSDNYMYLLHDSGSGITAAVDPAETGPILAKLEEKGWELDLILSTHHHPDHVAGNLELKEKTGCTIFGPAAERDKIPGIDTALSEGDRVGVGVEEAIVYETPGHTAGHISFWFEGSAALFCADTLFALGCGRLFEGTPAQMWDSMQKYSHMPDETRVFCGHEYTQSNAHFALTVDPENAALRTRAAEIDRLRAAGEPTVPSLLGEERATNPFLRPDDAGIRTVLGMADASDAEVFGELRSRKDNA